MPQVALSLASPLLLVANQVYSIPARSGQVSFQSPTGSTLQGSLDGTNFAALGSGTPSQVVTVFTNSLFIKTTSSDTTVVAKSGSGIAQSTGSFTDITASNSLTVTNNIVSTNGNIKISPGGVDQVVLTPIFTTFGGIYLGAPAAAQTAANFAMAGNTGQTIVNAGNVAPAVVELRIANVTALGAGTAGVIINGASNTTPSKPLSVFNAAKTTELFAVSDTGAIKTLASTGVAAFGPAAVASITVVNGIITAIS